MYWARIWRAGNNGAVQRRATRISSPTITDASNERCDISTEPGRERGSHDVAWLPLLGGTVASFSVRPGTLWIWRHRDPYAVCHVALRTVDLNFKWAFRTKFHRQEEEV